MTSNAIASTILLLAGYAGCNRGEAAQNTTLQGLYKSYKEGAIDECKLNGRSVYVAGLNAYDAGTVILDESGNKIATCNYGWGPVDSLCKQLTSCVTVYRCKGHITGEPFIDKYGLSK